MPASNELYFRPDKFRDTYLRARGFDRRGNRSGGIKSPVKVLIQPSTILIRFFHDEDSRYGGWWTTPRELSLIFDHFGVGGGYADPGRAVGKGIMHAALAVRHEWSIRRTGAHLRSDHLARFWIAETNKPLYAFYGEGDSAASADQTSNLKPVRISGGTGENRSSMQLYLPNLVDYKGALHHVRDGRSDADLAGELAKISTAPLYFE